jgi:hypothetical protein
VVAAMEAQAFAERDVEALLDCGTSFIPRDCVIARAIDDIRGWHAHEPDWRATRQRIEERYGYDRYLGVCHVVPNHALIVLALLYGGGDFARSLAIVNTSGWDTDCNSGNVGCLLGIRNGLAGIGPEWREPVADRMYLSSADGGRAVTDAATETLHVVNTGRALAGEPPWTPGARFHFELPGSVQGFRGTVENVGGALSVTGVATTPTFIPGEALEMSGYALQASPTLFPGQTVRAHTDGPCRLLVRVYDGEDRPATVHGPAWDGGDVEWRVPDTGGQPVAEVGIEAPSTVRLERLTWDGAPEVVLTRPAGGGSLWRRAWVQGVDRFDDFWREPYRLIQNRGRGLLIQGTREWTDYEVGAAVVPEMVAAAGIAARVQGMRRYYALLLCDDDTVRLVKSLDGDTVLATAPLRRDFGVPHRLSLRVTGTRLHATVDDATVLEADDRDRPLDGGAVALVCERGCLSCDAVTVGP